MSDESVNNVKGALQILSNAARLAQLTYQDHEACKQSVNYILKFIKDVELVATVDKEEETEKYD